ncbi:MAG TPA: hypothetical protein VFU31_22145 [Candidatus Binatia bacterium]|nr:hypothetical protein [Candidatus Binatia bacterium]
MTNLTPAEMEDFCRLLAECNRFDRERQIRNRERECARNAGYTGEPYWETLPLEVLIEEQRKSGIEV